jgi:3-methyladenine DNA glycosylase AlkD
VPSPIELADSIEAELRALGDPERAQQERAYLKSDLEFLGMPVASVRKAARRHRDLGHEAVIDLVEALWSVPLFERRLAAVEVLTDRRDLLVPADIGLVERLLRDSRTWALVDPLAVYVAGSLAAAYPGELSGTLDRWVEDDDFWVRRAALLALLVPLRDGQGDSDRFFRYADGLLDETEFFIRKAIGWVLRDMSRRRPELVRDWLETRAHRASGVTMREAVKYLDPSDRDRLMAVYRLASRTGPRKRPSA